MMRLDQSNRAEDKKNQLQQLVYNSIYKNALYSSLNNMAEFRKGAYLIFWSAVLIVYWLI